MQLDKTGIMIRERDLFDLLDLCLRVIHGNAGALAICWLIGCLPCLVFNDWLLPRPPAIVLDDDNSLLLSYYWHLLLLIWWQVPLATAPLTIYLGQALFLEPARPSYIAHTLFQRAGQIVFFHLFLRGMAFVWSILTYVAGSEPALRVLCGFLAVAGGALPFFFWPYLNEVLLLERNPLRTRIGTPSTLSRVFSLHGQGSGEVFARSFVSAILSSCMIAALWGALILLIMQMTLVTDVPTNTQIYCFQIATWFVVGFMGVMRFVSYLDLRIRTEGWEIELLLRAEGARLARQVS